MYLMIMEDGEIYKIDNVNEEDLQMVDDGVIDLISISGPQPTQYYNGEWCGINGIPSTTTEEG